MRSSRRYNRALLKISGEALAGDRGFGLDAERTSWIAGEIATGRRGGTEVAVVIGGGNIMRGVNASEVGVPPLVGDQMGMIATVVNALALRAALESLGLSARVLSAFAVGTFVEVCDRLKALEYVSSGHVVVFAGGTGNPCFTTDSAAALRAVEIEADVMVKATQARGVFDKDPSRHSDAVFFETITVQEVLERRLGVMDAASVEILGRRKIPTIVLDLHVEGNIAKALSGENIGTLII